VERRNYSSVSKKEKVLLRLNCGNPGEKKERRTPFLLHLGYEPYAISHR
jgi:hypothetical protein